MTSKLKQSFYAAAAMVVTAPSAVLAQYTSPADDFGLATDASFTDLLTTLLNWILSILAILAILMIVVSGVLYMTSGGDEDRIGRAKSWLTYSIIGLVVALLGYVIVTAVGAALGSS